MTNEQTYILLKSLRERTARAINEAAELIPDELRSTRKRHKGIWPCACSFSNTPNPDHYEDVSTIPALDPLYDLLDSIDEDLELLRQGKDSEQKTKSA